jgi:hypothetical protein
MIKLRGPAKVLTRRAKHWQNGMVENVLSPRGAIRRGIFRADLLRHGSKAGC